jgi:flagellar basal body-associated protein FliL
VQEAFTIVLFVVVAVAAVAAVWALATSGGSYDEIGRGGMSLGEERTAAGDREAEIRQMLEARNARRAARGEAPQDVEAELRALTDPEVRDEVRTLVEARNARRIARGEAPLDVEAEIERRLRDF